MWVCLFVDCSGNSQSAESTPVPGHEPSTEGAPMHAGGNRDSSEDIWEWTGGSWGCRFASGKHRVRFGGAVPPLGACTGRKGPGPLLRSEVSGQYSHLVIIIMVCIYSLFHSLDMLQYMLSNSIPTAHSGLFLFYNRANRDSDIR